MATRHITSLADLQPDKGNANRGTSRGRALLERSLRQYGAGRLILVDKHGVIIAGNKTAEEAAAIGLPVEVVRTKGEVLVAVQREDLDLATDPRARELAYIDNRSGQLDLDFDVQQILADVERGLTLDAIGFRDDELQAMIDREEQTTLKDAEEREQRLPGNIQQQVKPVLSVADLATFERAIRATKNPNRGAALITICEFYLQHGEHPEKG